MYITLTEREFHTVLASLERAADDVHDGYFLDEELASNSGLVVPLSLGEIEDLAERINIETGKQIHRIEHRERRLTPPSWVDFGTSLPGVAQSVLLLICGTHARGGKWSRIQFGFLEDGRVRFNWFVSGALHEREEVRAWCPLPILPKERM